MTGPENRTAYTDATGFYGFVGLTPGSYTVQASHGSLDDDDNLSITAGNVSDSDLSLTSGGGGTVVVVDNSDSGFSASGNWLSSSWASDRYGADYHYRDTGSVSDAAIWTANLPSSGTYDVYAWWTEGSNRATSAPYIVDDTSGSHVVGSDQTSNGGQWNYLGSYQLNAGSNTVRLSCWTSTGDVVIADAVKWEKQ